MKVLVTGGAGYIASTISSALLDAGHEVVVLDDLSTGRADFVDGPLYKGDIADPDALRAILADHPGISTVIHSAARAVVADSVRDPLDYYEMNVARTLRFLGNVCDQGIRRIIFSSTASIYEPPPGVLADEDSPVQPRNPYAWSKVMCDQVLADLAASGQLRALSLRYVTPLGADPKLRSGLQPDVPWRIMGMLLECAREGRAFPILGAQWPSQDGTPIRDYIHVWDLARAHVRAVERFDAVMSDVPFRILNLATGRATTVREIIHAFEEVTGARLRVEIRAPRPGDTFGCAVSSDRAQAALGWKPELTVRDALRDAIRWADRIGA